MSSEVVRLNELLFASGTVRRGALRENRAAPAALGGSFVAAPKSIARLLEN